MIEESDLQMLRRECLGAEIFSTEVLNWIEKENLWNLWVPENFGGREVSFGEGVKMLRSLAKTDGSLGWTVTLCSGANYFIGNMEEKAARNIFLDPSRPVCLGGSGEVGGIAEETVDGYKIGGKWHYATGAPYLSHFTLNAKIQRNGKLILNENGLPQVRSFVLPRSEVRTIEDWDAMGLKATCTHSFEVNNAKVDKNYMFMYDKFHLPQPIFKIPFSLFANITLWINYIGMAEHFMEEAKEGKGILEDLKNIIEKADQKVSRYTEEIEIKIDKKSNFEEDYLREVHTEASHSIQNITVAIISAYPFLGVKACRESHQLNQVFRDYFTSTQHHNFTKNTN